MNRLFGLALAFGVVFAMGGVAEARSCCKPAKVKCCKAAPAPCGSACGTAGGCSAVAAPAAAPAAAPQPPVENAPKPAA